MKKILPLLVLSVLVLGSCGETPTTTVQPTVDPTTTATEPTTVQPTTSEEPTIEPTSEVTTSETPTSEEPTTSEEPINYGKVYFPGIAVHDGLDGVGLYPYFDFPDVCKDEVFTYTSKNEDRAYIEDGKVYFGGETGQVTITATSQHMTKKFVVDATPNMNKSDVQSKIKGKRSALSKVDPEQTILFGDSYFEFWNNGTNNVTRSSEVFKDYKVMNLGVSASTVSHWRTAFNYIFFENMPEEGVKNIVINLGVNDIDDDHDDEFQTFLEVRAMLLDLTLAYPNTQIYWQTILKNNCFSYNNTKYELTNTSVIDWAKDYPNIHILDVAAEVGDDYASYQVADGLHPNQKGYDLFEKYIKENVELVEKR